MGLYLEDYESEYSKKFKPLFMSVWKVHSFVSAML